MSTHEMTSVGTASAVTAAKRMRWSQLPIRYKLWLIMIPLQLISLAIPTYWLVQAYERAQTQSYLQACRKIAVELTGAPAANTNRSESPVNLFHRDLKALARTFGHSSREVAGRFRLGYLHQLPTSELSLPPMDDAPSKSDGALPTIGPAASGSMDDTAADPLLGLSELASAPLKTVTVFDRWVVTAPAEDERLITDAEQKLFRDIANEIDQWQRIDSESSDMIRVWTTALGPDARSYAVSILEVSRKPLEEDLRRMNAWALLLGLLGAVVLLPAIHYAVAVPVVSPVQQLARLMREAAPESLGTMRVTVNRQDEIGELQQSFNALAQEIGDKQRQLEQHRASLELRVAQRTAELAGRNQELLTAITSLEQTKDELEQVNAALAKTNGELDAFAYIVSHDLQAPLRNVKFLVQEEIPGAMQRGEVDEVQSLLTMSGQLCQFNIEMVRELLNWSRTARDELKKDPVDVNQVLDDVKLSIRTQLDEQQAVIRVANRLPVVLCGRIHVHRILTNLITNGIKYNAQPVKVIEIGTSTVDGSETAIYVRDNGIGIEPRNMGKLFSLLVQLHKPEQFGKGVGLGLAIVKKLVEAYNGRIWAESEYGVGTTFWLTLPLAAKVTDHEV